MLGANEKDLATGPSFLHKWGSIPSLGFEKSASSLVLYLCLPDVITNNFVVYKQLSWDVIHTLYIQFNHLLKWAVQRFLAYAQMCVTSPIAILEHVYHHGRNSTLLSSHLPNPLSLNPKQLFSVSHFTNLFSVVIDLLMLRISYTWNQVTRSLVSGFFHLWNYEKYNLFKVRLYCSLYWNFIHSLLR